MSDSAVKSVDLPLRWATPQRWATQALSEPLALLNDHAHLEKKAARNALELLDRWPDPAPPAHWVQTLAAIARDEVEHLAQVSRILQRRSGTMSKYHRNPYASELRRLVRLGLGTLDLIDRLLVSALIEARSCERFRLLALHGGDADLVRMYEQLWASEHGHYRVFLEMARLVEAAAVVQNRWDELLDAEAAIITRQPAGPRMHSGVT